MTAIQSIPRPLAPNTETTRERLRTCARDEQRFLATLDTFDDDTLRTVFSGWLGAQQPAATLRACVTAACVQPAILEHGGVNAPWLAQAFYESGAISRQRALEMVTAHWQGTVDLPPCLREHIATYATEEALLAHLPLPGPPGDARNMSFMARALAAWRAPKTVGWWMWTKDKIWRLVHWLKPKGPPATQPPTTCSCCMEAFDADHEPFGLEECEHPPEFGRTCFLIGLAANGGQACPTAGCDVRLTPRDALALELGAARADVLALKNITDRRHNDAQWRNCPTDGCPNGASIPPQTSRAFTCRCCGTTSVLFGHSAAFGALSVADRAQVRLLVHDAVRVRALDWGTPRRGLVRECYHCGVATQHNDGCMSFDCTRCKQPWNFVHGIGGKHQFRVDTQHYVPKRSWLVSLGLYEGLQPGQTDVDVAPVLRTNLRRLESRR